MKKDVFSKLSCVALVGAMFLSACSTPTLVEVARRRQATVEDRKANPNVKDDVRVKYSITDLDVLNFTDEVKRKLANRSSVHMGVGYGSAGTQATLGALAGAAKAVGWGVSVASGLGLGATYIFGMGQIFDPKGRAQAYEQSFTAIQAAEATYYFHQLGMSFNKVTGHVDPGNIDGRSDIPSSTNLTPDGETLYYRVSKILKVLNDTLANKIPDLQDLKEAHGEPGGLGSPAIPAGATAVGTPGIAGPRSKPPSASDNSAQLLQQFGWPGGVKNDQNVGALREWMNAHGLSDVDPVVFIHDPEYVSQRKDAVRSLHL